MLFQNVVFLVVLAVGVYLAIKFSKKSDDKNEKPVTNTPVEPQMGIGVKIIEFVDDHQPGFVRCTFTDAYGKAWFITEKVPIVSAEDLDENSQYPTTGFVAGEIKKTFVDGNGREVVTIDIDKPCAISEENGETVFDVVKEQIVEQAYE